MTLVQLRKSKPEASHAEVGPPEAGKSLFVETYGCQMNVADTDLIGSILLNDGYRLSPGLGEADVVLINTCAVREKAEEKVLQRLTELAAAKRKNPGSCWAWSAAWPSTSKSGSPNSRRTWT